MARETSKIAVIGAGDMGHGVAELAALRGFEVRLRDVRPDLLDAALWKVRWSLDKLSGHDTLTHEAANAAYARIRPTIDLGSAVADADLVIEAVPENLELKRRVFAEIEGAAPAHAVLASNTSAIRLGEIAEGLADPSRLVGMHFFNPVLLMDLIEVIPGDRTAKDATQTVVDVSKKLGKTTVVCRRDTPGFITSRLVATWVGAALLLHEREAGTPEEIDAAMKFKAGFPMGPFELADYTGVDVGYHAGEYLASRLGRGYAPAATLKRLVDAGRLGKKTGRGFHEWRENRLAVKLTPETGRRFDPALVLAVVANEASKLVEEGVGTPAEVDLAMRNGCAFPKGPLEWADEHGLDNVLKILLTLEDEGAHGLLQPTKTLKDLVEQGRFGKKSGKGFRG